MFKGGHKAIARLLGWATFAIIGLSGCTKTIFTSSSPSLDAQGGNGGFAVGQAGSTIKDQTVVTQMNTPISFTASLSSDNGQSKRLVFPDGTSSFHSSNGLLEIVDAAHLQYRYTPNNGYRGVDTMTVYLADSNNVLSQATLTVDIGNALSTMQPALATRSTGCIMCHSNVASNIITDFGYGGDGKGLNYFFGGVPGVIPAGLTNAQGGSLYGDYDFSQGGNVNWGAANITGEKVIVPVAPTAGLVNVAGASLAAYLTGIFANPNALTKNLPVQEVSSLYIGAPTAQRILAVSGLVAPATLKFIPETANSPDLTGIGLSSNSSYYTNVGTVVCNGDLVIDKVLWLNNLQLSTEQGCRIYSTKSVFITGTVTYTSSAAQRNLQISSSRAVLLGIGHSCGGSSVDSINGRLTVSDGRYAGAFTRNLGTPNNMLATLKADADIIGALQDATCGAGGRNVGFDRLLLNAPVIESRYQGVFSGTLISEITLTSLSSLRYAFSPVFSDAVILPLLSPSDYLTVTH